VKESNLKDIKVDQFSLAYKSMVLLKDTDLSIVHGRKYGLIGPNGSGKSTLLRHISQRHFAIPDHIQILHVEQEIEGTDQIALDAVVSADVERLELLAELEKLLKISEDNTDEGLAAHDRVIEIHKRLRAIGAHSAEARAAAILSGLQFTSEMQKKKTREFSGGWRMRISLARALFVLPDLLLLDEPTNHLDLDAVIWLEAYLRKYKKTLLLVSHDREFLNGVITDIICVREQKLEYYKGNYDSYEKGLTQKKRQHEKIFKEQEKKKAQLNKKQDKNARDGIEKNEKKGNG
jgi:ATPase subunit of ABC transporter with duplicated ATPase domains